MTQVFSQMTLGLSVYKLGYHRAAWRMPDFPQNAMMSLDAFTDAARAAEGAKFDFVFFADISAVENLENPTRDISLEHYVVKLDPIVALSAISAVTSHIGLVGTVSTTYTPPYRIARQIASLDVISHGRAGWNVVTSYSPYERQNFGVEDISNIDARYARAHEAIDVVQGLWNSWKTKPAGSISIAISSVVRGLKETIFRYTARLTWRPLRRACRSWFQLATAHGHAKWPPNTPIFNTPRRRVILPKPKSTIAISNPRLQATVETLGTFASCPVSCRSLVKRM